MPRRASRPPTSGSPVPPVPSRTTRRSSRSSAAEEENKTRDESPSSASITRSDRSLTPLSENEPATPPDEPVALPSPDSNGKREELGLTAGRSRRKRKPSERAKEADVEEEEEEQKRTRKKGRKGKEKEEDQVEEKIVGVEEEKKEPDLCKATKPLQTAKTSRRSWTFDFNPSSTSPEEEVEPRHEEQATAVSPSSTQAAPADVPMPTQETVQSARPKQEEVLASYFEVTLFNNPLASLSAFLLPPTPSLTPPPPSPRLRRNSSTLPPVKPLSEPLHPRCILRSTSAPTYTNYVFVLPEPVEKDDIERVVVKVEGNGGGRRKVRGPKGRRKEEALQETGQKARTGRWMLEVRGQEASWRVR
ncbi:hypothetical protein JCM8547_001326 [Rhodosporidiobolus lusitaniae]